MSFIDLKSLKMLLSDGNFELNGLEYKNLKDEIYLAKTLMECPELRDSKRITENCINYIQACTDLLL